MIWDKNKLIIEIKYDNNCNGKRGNKKRSKTQERQEMLITVAHHVLTCPASPWAAIGSSWSTPSTLCTGDGILPHGIFLGPVWASCLGCAPSHLLTVRAWKIEKPLTQSKHYLAQWCFSCCYQHFSHTQSQNHSTLPAPRKKINSPSRNQDSSTAAVLSVLAGQGFFIALDKHAFCLVLVLYMFKWLQTKQSQV